MNRPRVKLAHMPRRRPTGALWVGSLHYGLGSEVDDYDGTVAKALALMDGTRDFDDVVSALATEVGVESLEARGLIEQLIQQGWIEEATVTQTSLSQDEIDRYSRSRDYFAWVDLHPRTSPYEVQESLQQSRVAVLGIGGIGSLVSMNLVALGIGELTIVDFDVVELSNLNRQVLYRLDQVGRPKTSAAFENLHALNPNVSIRQVSRRLEESSDFTSIIDDVDLFVLCADRPAEIAYWANSAAILTRKPWILSSYNGPMSSVGVFIPGITGCYRCMRLRVIAELTERGQADLVPSDEIPPFTAVIAPTAQIAAGWASLEAVYFLSGIGANTVGRVYHQNLLDYDQSYYVDASPFDGCPECQGDGES